MKLLDIMLKHEIKWPAEMTEAKRLRQIWRQLRDYGSKRGFEMDYKFLRSCAHYAGVV